MSPSVVGTRTPAPPRIGRGIVALLAVATGLSVANNYYAQPLLDAMRGGLHLSPGTAGLVVTVAQIGYALGLVFLLPLGDLVQQRRLVVALTAANAAGLAAMASATSAAVLLGASVVVGVLSVVAQILVPFAAALASPEERGRVVGTVMSGLLLGILLARTAAGLLGRIGGWPTVYWVAAALMVALAVALRVGLPAVPPPARQGSQGPQGPQGYASLLRSILALVREEPVLRLRMIYGALSFAMFSVLWTSLTFLLSGPPYGYPVSVIGLFGLVGAAGALGANIAGRLADRGAVHRTTAAGIVLIMLSWLPIWLGGHSLVPLLAGIIALDLAAQMIHISNQNEIYRLRPEARSRLNSAYMTAYFIGGALGSALSSYVYDATGWPGVCALGAAFGVGALAVLLVRAVRS